ncbi:hypothetical protein AV530_007955 [Patagioenas fasciata monilis]|uniref:Uncharacterized protein n=1 Tax=Patagioenas fasciata monilis TaxID=372326 RepID=A0A1V4KTT3_PATFA|nr:hypothetical protein AV530_007955 [Patagioenas fasciata monilis]
MHSKWFYPFGVRRKLQPFPRADEECAGGAGDARPQLSGRDVHLLDVRAGMERSPGCEAESGGATALCEQTWYKRLTRYAKIHKKGKRTE